MIPYFTGSAGMDVLQVIRAHYEPGTPLYALLLDHSRRVRDKALAVARAMAHLAPDMLFIDQAAMLHDIGIGATAANRIHCHGTLPYVCHGVVGGRLLNACGLTRHALVCERHVGVGLSRDDIVKHNLPLPPRDMLPVTLEEAIVCYADKFYSKNRPDRELTPNEILSELGPFGHDRIERFRQWHFQFTGERLEATLITKAPE